MITQILADGRPVDLIAHRITPTEAATVAKVLAVEGLRVEPTEPDFEGVDNHPQAPGSRLRPDEDRLAAIVLLLQDKAGAIADAIERGLADA